MPSRSSDLRQRRATCPLSHKGRGEECARKASSSHQAQIGERCFMMLGAVVRKTTERHLRNAACVRRKFRRHRADRDTRGEVGRKMIDAGRDRRKAKRREFM